MTILSRILCVLLLPACLSPASAASVSLTPAADAFVTTGPANDLRDNNYGAAGGLAIAAPGSTNGEFQSVLRFDLAGAVSSFDTMFGPGQWSLESVTLRLTATAPNNPIFNGPAAGLFSAQWMQNDSWIEGTGGPSAPTTDGVSFNSLQGTFISPGADEHLGTFSFNGATSGNASYPLGLPAAFVTDLAAGGAVSLRLLAADGEVSYLFNSRNFGMAANRPLLTVTAVPEPGVLTLGAFAATVWLIVRRLRQRPNRD
jgi:hypothetical protein